MTKRPLVGALLTLCIAVFARGQCSPQFLPGYDFGRLRPSSTSAFDSIFCAAVFDDHSGSGPALFIGGYLSVIGDQGGAWMAKLVGDHWVAVAGFDGPPRCMAVVDDGSGPALFVGGSFTAGPGGTTGCLVKWDGAHWSGMGLARGGYTDSGLYSLAWHDDGHGPSLFAGGRQFNPPGQLNPSLVMRFDGAAWHSLGGTGWQSTSLWDPLAVRTMVTFDAGSGPRLFVGGSFNSTPSGASNCVAVWDGQSWLPGGSGLSSNGVIKSLAPHQGSLFAAGDAGPGATAIWRLNGGTWVSAYGVNAEFRTVIGGTALLSFDDGSGPALYGIVGQDSHLGSEVVALRDGAWQTCGPQFINELASTFMTTLIAAPINGQNALVAVGRCSASGVSRIPNVGAWAGGAWRAVEPVGRGVPGTVSRILSDPETDDGSVYIGGWRFSEAGVTPSGLPLSPQWMVRWRHGNVSELVISDGLFSLSNSGSGWQLLPDLPLRPSVLTVARDTGEESLVIAERNDSIHQPRVMRLGASWTPVGSPFSVNAFPTSLATYDNGQGARLFLGGSLGTLGGVTNCRLAYFDGSQWQPVPGLPGHVREMSVFDIGDGPELFLACQYDSGDTASHGAVVRWNGTRLDDLTANLGPSPFVATMIPFDAGTGPRLWIACPGSPLGDLAFWNGSAWQSRPDFVFDVHGVFALADVRRSNGTRSLLVGGSFMHAAALLASHLAELAACPRTCTADFDGDGDTATDADIEAFFACIAGTCCAQCGNPDFNNDGDPATSQDIEAFFRVLAGGSC
jgi:hypothetical protein